MTLQAAPVFTAAALPTRQIGTGALPTSAPTATDKMVAHGRSPDSSIITLEVSGACILTLWVFSTASGRWINPGASAARYTLTFAAGDKSDFFQVYPGELFYIQSDTGSINCYTNGLPAKASL